MTGADEIRCIVCGTTLAQVLWAPAWSDHMHAWDEREEAARIIAASNQPSGSANTITEERTYNLHWPDDRHFVSER